MPAIILRPEITTGDGSGGRQTIVRMFISVHRQIDKIRSRFSELFSLKGLAKIGVYNNFDVFLDFANDDDIITIWFKRSVEINGQQMWHQKWSRDFKPEEDLPIASVWALLPKLQMHLTQLVLSEADYKCCGYST